MSLISMEFLTFVAVAVIGYYLIPKRYQWVWLLAFSYIYYASSGMEYLVFLLYTTVVTYGIARMIYGADQKFAKQKEKIKTYKKSIMVLALLLDFGMLAVLKYTNFAISNVNTLFHADIRMVKFLLPLGISFYTFQLLSYVVDVYRKEVAAQPAYWKLLLYCSLFHQCIAGPIVRYQTVAAEIDDRKVTLTDLTNGIRRFSIGLAKKAILANGCASVADTLLANTQSATTAGLWLGMLFYMLQIYLDFSAYSDMAIGMGQMVGFHYLENFNYPYSSVSVQDFWRRWHISLSSFFRDYVYIPLGGSRGGDLLTVRNMFIVWALTGIWHGASWNYILWGLYFFVFLVLERFVLKKVLERLPRAVGWIYAMLVVYFGWVLFKFENMAELGNVLSGMFGFGHMAGNLSTLYTLLNNIFLLIISIIAVFPIGKNLRMAAYHYENKRKKVPTLLYYLDAVTPVILILLSLLALVGDSYNPFLYFQF